MEAATFFPSNLTLPHLSTRKRLATPQTRGLVVTKAMQGEGDQDEAAGNRSQQRVDDNMVVLRMRIKKLKVLESGGTATTPPSSAPSDWNEWEKRVFVRYKEGVCDSMDLLQSFLMNTRPSVALGLLALLAMSVPLSGSVAMANALKVARGLLAGCHVYIDIDF